MSRSPWSAPRRAVERLRRRRDEGRISLLIAGLLGILGLLVLGGVDVTAVMIARTRVLDASDSAAADAADAIDEGAVYGQGIDRDLRLSTSGVRATAGRSLAAQKRPAHVASWHLDPATGSPDGRTAVVRVTADVRPPITGGFLSFFGDGVRVHVESRARADVVVP